MQSILRVGQALKGRVGEVVGEGSDPNLFKQGFSIGVG